MLFATSFFPVRILTIVISRCKYAKARHWLLPFVLSCCYCSTFMLKWANLKHTFFPPLHLALNSSRSFNVPLLPCSFHRHFSYIASHSNLYFSHALFVKRGLETDTVVATDLLLSYFTTGQVSLARSLFAFLFQSNTFLLNCTLKELSDDGFFEKILHLYFLLRISNAKPDHFTYPYALKACASLTAFKEGKLVHTQILKSGFDTNIFIANSLIDMYSKVESLDSACGVFDEMPEWNLVSWNCLISGYVLNGFYGSALEICGLMKFEGLRLDKVTLKILLPACGLRGALRLGESLHAYANVFGYSLDRVILTAIMDMYAKCGIMDAAEVVFEEIPCKDVVAWNAIISGYSRKGELDMVLKFFHEMHAKNVELTVVTMLISIQACADMASLRTGETIHGYITKSGICTDISIDALLINMYSKCGKLDLACQVSQKISEDVTSWSAIIHGLGMHGYGEAALMSFFRMLKRGINPDSVCFLIVLSSCSHTGMLKEGYRVFDYMVRQFGIQPNMEHYVTMVDLMGRAGFIDEAFQFIEGMPIEPDINIWGAFLGACKIHGDLKMGNLLEHRMVELGPKTAGYYKLLLGNYVSKGRWDEIHRIRNIIREGGVQRVLGHSLIEVKV